MAATNVRGRQLRDDDVMRADLNVTTSGSAVIRKVLSGAGIALSSTGVDSGTGDVTITLSTSGVTAGSYGSSTLVPIVTVDTYGRVTSITTATVSGGGGGGSSVRCEQTLTATANQTLFSGLTCTLTSGYFDVFVNGVKVNSASFSNTSNSITFTDGLAAGDIVDVVNYGIFSTSVTTANGFTGTVANATTTPAITLSTSVNGIIKGSGGALVAAVAGTDFQAPITLTTTGSSGAASFTSNTLNIPTYTLAGLGGQPGSANLTSLSGLTFTSTSFVKMTAAGTFALDTNAYALTNQTMFIGTTSVAINRASASLSLTGVSIDGNAGTVTNGVYTTGNQTIGGSKTFSSTVTASSIILSSLTTTGRFLFVSTTGGQIVDTTKMTYVVSGVNLDPVVTLGAGTDAPQIKFNYTAGGDFTGQLAGTDQMSFGFNNSAGYEGIAGVASGRTIYFYDRVSAAYILGATPTKVFIGPTGTNYGLSVARPNANIRGISVLATGQIQFNTYTTSTSFTGTSVANLAVDSSGNIITVAASGTVTSVALSLPAIFTVTGSPVTTTGTLTATLASQTANTFFAAPDGVAGAPTFRTILSTDIPNLDASKIAAGQLTVARGGTGSATLTGVLIGNGVSAFSGVVGTAGQLLRRNAGDTAYEFFTPSYLTANQSITLSGDVSGTGTTAITATLATVTQSTGSSFVKITLDTKGRVTGNTAVAASDLHSTYGSQTANTFYAAPNGAAGNPSFRAIVAADIPTLNQNTTGSAGSVANSFIVRADSGTTEGTDIYTFNGSAAKNLNIVAGTNVTITKTAGQWSIAATGGTTLNGTGFVRMSGTTASYVTGTASQFVKADGTLDSTSYQTALTNPVTGTATSGQIAYWSGATAQTGSANLVYDAANTRVNLGGGVTGFLNASNINVVGTTSIVGMTVRNTSSATGVTQAGFYLENATSNAQLFKTGTAYTTYKIITADDLGFYNAVAGDISILNDYSAGQILFAAGGSNTAHLTIGTTGASTFSNNVTAAQFIRSGGTASQFLKADGSIDSTSYASVAGATFTGQIISTQANSTTTGGGQIYLNGATGNRIDFNNNGVSGPTFTTRGVGTKIVFRPTLSATLRDYALGYNTNELWMTLADQLSTHRFTIYAGANTNPIFTVRGDGLTVINAVSSTVYTAAGAGWMQFDNGDSTANVQIYNNAATTAADLTWLYSPTNRQVTWLFTALTATTRTYTLPNASGTMVLSVNGTTADATGNITISTGGGGGYTVTSQTANYTETATSGTKIIKCDTTAGAFTVTLPTAVSNQATIIIKKTAGSAALTVDGAGSETIDGGATAVLNLVDESITLVSDNANWLII